MGKTSHHNSKKDTATIKECQQVLNDLFTNKYHKLVKMVATLTANNRKLTANNRKLKTDNEKLKEELNKQAKLLESLKSTINTCSSHPDLFKKPTHRRANTKHNNPVGRYRCKQHTQDRPGLHRY